ncbi:hypothetical protein [Nitrolancea hollandica]|nr:hypothetical protein [Nitrolancea hollandica]
MDTQQDRSLPRPQHPLTMALGIVLLIPAVSLVILGLVALGSGLTASYERITPLAIGVASLAEAALFATAARFTLSRERHPIGWLVIALLATVFLLWSYLFRVGFSLWAEGLTVLPAALVEHAGLIFTGGVLGDLVIGAIFQTALGLLAIGAAITAVSQRSVA